MRAAVPETQWHRRLRRARRFFLGEPSGYVIAAATTGAITLVSYLAMPHADIAHVMILHLLAPVLISTRFGLAVSTFSAVSSVLAFDYFCVPPIFAFAFPDSHSVITLVSMLLGALTLCFSLQRLRHQRTLAREREGQTRALCELSLDLSELRRSPEVAEIAERHLGLLFGSDTRVLLRDANGQFELGRLPAHEHEAVELALARLETAFNDGAGKTILFEPIGGGPVPLGVVRARFDEDGLSSGELKMLLAACADRIALSLERNALSQAALNAEVSAETERLRNELLSAVSHDLKTPLSSILAAGTALLNRAPTHDENIELLQTIVDEAERLNTLLTNLLSVTRLESGRVRLRRTPEALDDLIFSVLSRLSSRLEGRPVEVDVPDDLPLVPVDAVLIDQVLMNLIENVLRYTPAGSPVALSVRERGEEVVLEVCDRGPGIAADERDKVFERFFRGKQAKRNDGGTGLGLTICRAVARAHGGRIAVRARESGGTTVEFALPCPSRHVALLTAEPGERPIA
ncbi:MAG TPA: ATP-binding protein [Polyangiaceae bacterium]|nr:ATP-binding protein [Polyangiaceae bacterium]